MMTMPEELPPEPPTKPEPLTVAQMLYLAAWNGCQAARALLKALGFGGPRERRVKKHRRFCKSCGRLHWWRG